MSKHTPGPWVETESVRPGHLITENGIVVARVFDASDARLISAAPDMAEALRRLCYYERGIAEDGESGPDSNEWMDAWDQARAALKKAGIQ